MTLHGQKPNSLETELFQRIIDRMIPSLQPQQEKILQDYMEMVDTNCRIKSRQAFGRRGGVSTIANAIALAEGHLGKSVIFMGETSFETRRCVSNIRDFSPLGEAALTYNVSYMTPKDNFYGRRCDILIYESFFSNINKDIARSFKQSIAAFQPIRAYMIHS